MEDDSYPFVVKIIKLDMKNGVVFDYDLQSANRLQARIELTPNALNNAQTLYNFFDGNDIVLNNSVSIFLSNPILAAIRNEKTSINTPAFTALIKTDRNEEKYIPFTKIGKEQLF